MYYIIFRYSGKRKLEIAALPDAVEPAAIMAMGNQTAMVLDIFGTKEGAVRAFHAIQGTKAKEVEPTSCEARARAIMNTHKLTEERVDKAVNGLAALAQYHEIPYADDMLAYLRTSIVGYSLKSTLEQVRAVGLTQFIADRQENKVPETEVGPSPEYFQQEFEIQPEPTITEAVEARPLSFAEKLALRRKEV